MRTVRILADAAEEAIEAAAWYERQRPGLGADFLKRSRPLSICLNSATSREVCDAYARVFTLNKPPEFLAILTT